MPSLFHFLDKGLYPHLREGFNSPLSHNISDHLSKLHRHTIITASPEAVVNMRIKAIRRVLKKQYVEIFFFTYSQYLISPWTWRAWLSVVWDQQNCSRQEKKLSAWTGTHPLILFLYSCHCFQPNMCLCSVTINSEPGYTIWKFWTSGNTRIHCWSVRALHLRSRSLSAMISNFYKSHFVSKFWTDFCNLPLMKTLGKGVIMLALK